MVTLICKNYPVTQSMKVFERRFLEIFLFPFSLFFKDAAGDTVNSCDYIQEFRSSAWKLFNRCCSNIRTSQWSIFF